MNEIAKGNLLIIGGAEDKNGDAIILRRFVELAGGREANIAVITTATEQPQVVGDDYQQIFKRLEARTVQHLDISTRQAANDTVNRDRIKDVTGIFFTGGDQLRITSILGGTVIEEAICQHYATGKVVAGTSAGASAMSDNMIVGGTSEDAPKQDTVRMAPGLALITGVAIDQHFAQRGRINRLLSVVGQQPNVLGLGIDEDTAVIISADQSLEVIGSSSVTIIDGRGLTFSNVSETKPDQPLALFNVTVHMVPASHGFHLQKRCPLPPSEIKGGPSK